MQVAQLLVLVDFGLGLELAGAQVAASFFEIGVGLNECLVGLRFAWFVL